MRVVKRVNTEICLVAGDVLNVWWDDPVKDKCRHILSHIVTQAQKVDQVMVVELREEDAALLHLKTGLAVVLGEAA